jgi:cation diffusion facilitator family transporter
MAVERNPSIYRVDADLSARAVDVYHDGPAEGVLRLLRPLNFGAEIVDSGPFSGELAEVVPANNDAQKRTLRIVLAINAGMFLVESIGGYVADSSALIADSLDMFADATVYAMALYGAGRALDGQRKAARLSGWLQLALAGGALFEVVRRAVAGSEPESALMMGVAVVALGANATCMWLLARHRGGGAHMKASWIFTTNDVIANVGVITGGILVRVTGSAVPDLVVGAVIGFVVFTGALRILSMARELR